MQHVLRTLRWQNSETRGQPITAYGRQVTPIGRVMRIECSWGGFVWHRPVAVEVREGEITRRLPIRNITQQAITSLTLAAIVIAWILARRTNKHTKEKR